MSHRIKYEIPHSDVRNKKNEPQYKVFMPFITVKHGTNETTKKP